MTPEQIEFLANQGAFRPRHHFSQLAADHVPFDELTGRATFEARALQAVIADDTAVGILGPRGAGKSSLIAYVCAHLPDTHVALRVPITGADDPTKVSNVAAVALSQALADIELEHYQREALERARADQTTVERAPGGLRGGTLGGGPIPAQVNVELGTLRQQLTSNQLAAERLAGLDRLITISSRATCNPCSSSRTPRPRSAVPTRSTSPPPSSPGRCTHSSTSSRRRA